MHVDCSSSETFDYSLCSLRNCNLSHILYYTQFCFINAPCLSSSLFFVAQSSVGAVTAKRRLSLLKKALVTTELERLRILGH